MYSRILVALSAAVLSGAACGDGAEATDIVYAPHTVLALETEVDVDGAPDIADPHVVRHDGTWYLYATQNKRDLRVWTSRDLLRWRMEGPVWKPTPGTWNAKGQVWAPHVEPTPDGWFLYYTADMQIGVARADSPLGPFVDVLDHPLVGGGYGGVGDGVFHYDPGDRPPDRVARFLADIDEWAIDAFVLRREHGEAVLFWSSYVPVSVIHARALSDWTTLASAPPVAVLGPDEPWEGLVAEGAFVVEHAGRFVLTYSANAADGPDYGVGMAVSDSPFGPYAKDRENPFLHKNPAAGFFGPGHHGLVEGAFGDLLMFYHTKVSPDRGYDRRIRYAPVAFDATGRLVLTVPQP